MILDGIRFYVWHDIIVIDFNNYLKNRMLTLPENAPILTMHSTTEEVHAYSYSEWVIVYAAENIWASNF